MMYQDGRLLVSACDLKVAQRPLNGRLACSNGVSVRFGSSERLPEEILYVSDPSFIVPSK